MPSVAKTIGLILLVASPACLTAQTFTPADSSFSPGERARVRAGQMRAGASQYPHLTSLQEEKGTVWTPDAIPSQRESRPGEVYSAAYQSPLPSSSPPAAPGEPPLQSQDDTTTAVSLSPPRQQSPLPLAPPGRSNGRQPDRTGGLPSVVTVAGSLAVVLGIFFLVAWGMRRAAPPGSTVLPGEVFEVLGRAPMASRQQVYLFRCGKKLVLVSVTTAGAETLTEITDPAEVDRLAGLCQQARPNSATAAFRQVFGQFSRQRLAPEFPQEPDHDRGPPTSSRVAASTGVPASRDGLENRDV